ncbi:MAG: YHYH protein [Luteolibacter sp.]
MNPESISRNIALLALLAGTTHAEPILSSWYTEGSGRYARIWATQAQETTERGGGGSTSLTTWDSADYAGVNVGDQPLPVYAGIQGISYSNSYVYIKSTGLANNIMGPWFLNAARTTQFPSFPGNAAILYRFPRSTNYASTYTNNARTASNIGSCGLFVDGVPLFNSSDTFSYDTSAGADQEPTNSNVGDGYWNRDAFTNEGVSFDAGNAHQAMEQFHYHASPAALRSTLGDSVDYDPSVVYQGIGGASPYTENFNGKHSPIIAWANDGLPMYGPYGYSSPLDPTSGVRRMITGYQKRDGTNGSTNLTTTGRKTLPQWTVTQGKRTTTTLTAAQYGPNVNATYTIGHYQEDYDYKGDRGLTLGTHFDLNAWNTRWCVTPEFPNGTWAYFTAVAENGTPVYPYNLAYQYFGNSTLAAGIASTAVETTGVTVQFGGASTILTENKATAVDTSAQTITITWQGIEGGVYRVEPSQDLITWSDTEPTTISASDEIVAVGTFTSSTSKKFYRLAKTGINTYDTTTFSTAAGGGGGPGGPPPR